LGKQGAIAVGGYISGQGFVALDPEAPLNTSVTSILDTSGLINIGFSNQTNRLSFGLTLRPIQRIAYEDTIPTLELANAALIQERIQFDSLSLMGMGVDAGLMFTFADYWFPTLGIAIRNIPTGTKQDFLNPYSKKNQTI